jgi:plasmid stabilization system protein ParE
MKQGDDAAGKAVVSRLIKSVSLLRSHPLSGRIGRIAGTRELFPRNLSYVLVYHIPSPAMVEIVRVIHTSRLFPETLFDADEEA